MTSPSSPDAPTARAGLPRVFWIVWVGTFVNRLGGFVVPFLSLFLTRERGFSVSQAGVVVSLFGVGQIFAGTLGGLSADHYGRKATLLVSLFGGALCMLALAVVRSTAPLYFLVPLLALVGEMYRPAVHALIADVVTPELRLRAFGLQYWVTNLGFSLATLGAGWLARRAYALLFLGDALTSALYGLVVLFGVPETRPPRHAEPHPDSTGASAVAPAVPAPPASGTRSSPLRDGVYLVFVTCSMLVAIIFAQLHITLPVFVVSQGLDETRYGSLIALNGVLIVLLQPLLGRIVRSPTPTLVSGALLQGLGFFLHNLASGVVGHALAVTVWTVGEIVWFPTSAAVIANLAPPGWRGRYQGVYSMALGLGNALGTLGGSSAMHRWGAGSVWWSCLLIGALAALGIFLTKSGRAQRTAQLVRTAQLTVTTELRTPA